VLPTRLIVRGTTAPAPILREEVGVAAS
jgi:hypothetical protein